MKPIFCCLEDGAVFEGRSVTEALECGGLLSFYTGVVGYQEVITDPANLGKIVVYTYPLIGNYGVNSTDAESSSPKAAGILAKEYPPYYSNFRAECSLKEYLDQFRGGAASAGGPATVLGHCFDTRAMLLHMREHGEMGAVVSTKKLGADTVKDRLAQIATPEYQPENRPIACAAAKPLAKAEVIDLGASRSFYRHLADVGIDATCNPDDAHVVIVSDSPYYAVEDQAKIDLVRAFIGKRPVIGFGHGCAIVASACGAKTKRLPFGDHGVNIPVSFVGGGRNEITVQNHNYVVVPDGDVKGIFTNLHDGTCEGFLCKPCKTAGANFLPPGTWFRAILLELEVA
ncbi:MAG: carbamoyl-phosphate synthase domain-containing protein [Armatimonadota bacterium]